MKRLLLALVLITLSVAVVRAQGPLTLAETLERVLRRYPTLDEAQAAVDAARGRTLQANSARLPQLSAAGNYLFTAPRPYVQFSLPTGSSSFYETTQNAYVAGVTGRQLLTDFGRTDALVAMARAGELSARDALEAARSQLGYQVIQAFYGALLLRQSVEVANGEIRALEEALRIANRKFTGGTATKFDVLTTQVRLATAQNSRTDTQAALERQETLLRQHLGLEPLAPIVLTGDFATPGTLPDLSTAIATGLETRPELRQARAAAAAVQAAQRENRPVLAAQASAGMENGQLPSLYSNRGYVSAGLSFSVPLFTGGRITGDRVEARANVRASEARIAEMTRRVATEVADAFADLKAAADRLQNADPLVSQADEALALARTRYTNGVITNFELLDAQSAARNAALARVEARYRWTLARQALAQATGAVAGSL